MTAYALIFVNFPAGATLDEVAVLYHSDMSAFYWHPNLTTSSTSSPYFSRSTQWSTASPWSTPGPSQYDVDLRLGPKSSNGSLHQLSTRLLRRLLHHTGGKFVLVSVVILFLAHFSAGLISGHLSSGRSVEAASTSSIWHFQVSPGWKKNNQLTSRQSYRPPFLQTNQPNNWPTNQLFKIYNHSLILIIMHQLQSFILKCIKL